MRPATRWRPGSALVVGVEGIDAAGKSTAVELLQAELLARGASCVVRRAGGHLPPEEQALADAADPAQRQQAFWDRIIVSEIEQQYCAVQEALRTCDVVVLDRTLISYLMGRSRVFQVGLTPSVIREAVSQFRHVPAFVPWDRLLLLVRPEERIREGLRERSSRGEALSLLEEMLVQKPGFADEEQRRLEAVGTVLGVDIYRNDQDLGALKARIVQLVDDLAGR